eukprot:g83150.t1
MLDLCQVFLKDDSDDGKKNSGEEDWSDPHYVLLTPTEIKPDPSKFYKGDKQIFQRVGNLMRHCKQNNRVWFQMEGMPHQEKFLFGWDLQNAGPCENKGACENKCQCSESLRHCANQCGCSKSICSCAQPLETHQHQNQEDKGGQCRVKNCPCTDKREKHCTCLSRVVQPHTHKHPKLSYTFWARPDWMSVVQYVKDGVDEEIRAKGENVENAKKALKLPLIQFSIKKFGGNVVDVSLRIQSVDEFNFQEGRYGIKFILFMLWKPEDALAEEWRDIDAEAQSLRKMDTKVVEDERTSHQSDDLTSKDKFKDFLKDFAEKVCDPPLDEEEKKALFGAFKRTDGDTFWNLSKEDIMERLEDKELAQLLYDHATTKIKNKSDFAGTLKRFEDWETHKDLIDKLWKKYWNAENEVSLINLVESTDPDIPINPPKLINIPGEKLVYGGKKGSKAALSVRSLDVTLSQPWDLQHFPFDTQVLNVIFRPRESLDQVVLRLMRPARFKTWMSPYALHLVPEFHMQDYLTSITSQPREHTAINALNRAYSTFVLGIPIQRDYRFQLMNTGLNLLALQLLTFAVFFIDIEGNLADRLTYIITLMLTGIALKLAISSSLPNVPYRTFSDLFFVYTVMMHTAAVFTVVLADVLVKKDNTLAELVDNCALLTLLVLYVLFLFYFIVKARMAWLDGQELICNDKNQDNQDKDFWFKLFCRPCLCHRCSCGCLCKIPGKIAKSCGKCLTRWMTCRRDMGRFNTIYNWHRVPWYLDQAVADGYRQAPKYYDEAFQLEHPNNSSKLSREKRETLLHLDKVRDALKPAKNDRTLGKKVERDVGKDLQVLWDKFRQISHDHLPKPKDL